MISKKNEVFLKITADVSIMQELSDYFTFEVPGARFSPAFRAKQWDGKIRLLNMYVGELYLGLISYIYEFCKSREYEFIDNVHLQGEFVQEETIHNFLDELNLQAHGESIVVRLYQLDAITQSLVRGRVLLISPTASGKSLIIYSLVRWHQTKKRKQLIIVPTTSLVEQMYGDFADYASADSWNVDDHCVRIYGGQEKNFDKDVIISTWQSIYKQPKSFFEQFDVIYGDEAHLYTAKSLTGIFHKTINAKFKMGTTGTLDGTKCHRFILEGLFGPAYKVVTTKQLMDDKHLANLSIKCVVLKYSDEEKKAAAKKEFKYPDEINFLISHEARNKLISQLAIDQKENTLLLFQRVEKHGKVLYDMIKKAAAKDRKIFFVHGGTDAEDREEIRAITELETNAIIIASVGVFSQGVSIRNLYNIISASPSKSRIRNLQSIGRGLRITEEKEVCKLYDIVDDLSWKSHKNYTLLHFIERVKIYNEEGFRHVLTTANLF